jgi:small multidrug resistance family-3 protein
MYDTLLALSKALSLFALTAVAEILGCWLPYQWLREGRAAWLLVPAAASLAPGSSAYIRPEERGPTPRTEAGTIAVAIAWLWLVEGKAPNLWDLIGAIVAMTGMAIIVLANRPRG